MSSALVRRDGSRAEGAEGIMTKQMRHSAAVAKLPKHNRYDELKGMLEQRQREILHDMRSKMRDARVDGAEKPHEVLDPGETAEVDTQEDLEFVLIEMKAETLNKISEALSRLDNGTYGNCVECSDEIAGARLRALPFAVRCKDCEEAREMAQLRERTQQRRSAVLGFDMREEEASASAGSDGAPDPALAHGRDVATLRRAQPGG